MVVFKRWSDRVLPLTVGLWHGVFDFLNSIFPFGAHKSCRLSQHLHLSTLTVMSVVETVADPDADSKKIRVTRVMETLKMAKSIENIYVPIYIYKVNAMMVAVIRYSHCRGGKLCSCLGRFSCLKFSFFSGTIGTYFLTQSKPMF